MSEALARNTRFIVTGLLVLFSIGFLGFFTESDKLSPAVQGFIVSLVFFLVIPVFYSKIVLKESLKNIGWQKGDVTTGIVTGIVAVAIALGAVIALAFTYPEFRAAYALPVLVEASFLWFMLYELLLVSLTVLLYEVFFRGLVQLSWLRRFGAWAALWQAGLFFGLFFLSQDVSWATVPLLLFSPFAGYIAHRTQSIWYSFGASWIFFFLTDIFFLVYH